MKTFAVYALALLLVSPALARPNLVEPIYLRRRSNPLEIVEESVESSGQLDSASQSSTEQQQPSISIDGTTTTTTDVTTGGGSAHTKGDTITSSAGTTTLSSTGSSSGSGSTSTHQPRYQTTNVGLSSDSLIKEFLLKNLANLRGPTPPPPSPLVAPAVIGTEEQNTLRSVSFGYPPLPSWDPPEKTYIYPVKAQHAGERPVLLEVNAGQKRKPVIHKIVTKWSDQTSDVFNVDYGTAGVTLLRPSSPIYGHFDSSTPAGIAEHSVHQQVYGPFGSPEVHSVDVYGQGSVGTSDHLVPLSSSGTKNKKKHKKKNKIKITIKPTEAPRPPPPPPPPPVKVSALPESDPDRPDAFYSGEQVGVVSSWNPYEDPYDEVVEANPYDEAGNLKGEEVTDTATECNEINISVNGKQGCNDIQIAINPSATKQGELTKVGPGVSAAVPGVAAAGAAAAIGAAGALSAAPQAAAAIPAGVASDVVLAAPLGALAAAPLAANSIAPLSPAGAGAPVSSFLNTPISSLVNNIIRPPVRIGAAGQPAATVGNGIATNQNKVKPKPSKGGHHGGSSLLPDMSHALLGMLAAVSAMTPMNMFVLGLTSLPVLAMLVGTLAAGAYMYKAYNQPPIRHFTTTTVLVQKKPPPVTFHGWTRHPSRRPVHSSSAWLDYDHSWNGPVAGWENDRRSMRAHSTEPYRKHEPSSPAGSSVKTRR